jgi:hypothetical protein
MATTLEMLNADMREVLAHMQAFPDDKYAAKKYSILEQAIEANTPPAMSHQRKRVDLDDLIKNPPAPYDWQKGKYAAPPVQHPCRVCDHQIGCMECVHASTAAILDRNVILPDPVEMHDRTRKAIDEVVNKPRYTFGADYEMDQLWLAAEREKVAGSREDRHTLPQHQHTPLPEFDKMMFPSSAFCLTDMANVRYGRLG